MKTDDTPEPVAIGSLAGLARGGQPASPALILLHGYGGDERVMWVFAEAAPRTWTIVSLRGIASAPEGGYRWHVGLRWPPPPASAFAAAVASIKEALPSNPVVVWMGFSQGAALALCCAAAGLPAAGVACLAGFMPPDLTPLPATTAVLWAHGRHDDQVPIESARAAGDVLRAWGVSLEFCEADTGHKVGADCLRALRQWLPHFAGS